MVNQYRERVSRSKPGLIVMILDDSGSMTEILPGTNKPKYQWVEQYAGVIFKELLSRSTVASGDTAEIRPRYFVYTIPYGSAPSIWPAGATEELPIDALIKAYGAAGNKLGLSGGLGGTDARAAFEQAYNFLQGAISNERYQKSFPPMVFHLTDGMSASDASPVAQQIAQLSTSDGNALVVNAFMGAKTSLKYRDPGDFPGYQTEAEAGPDGYSQNLFRMSSAAPDTIRMNLVEMQIFPQFQAGARLYFDVRTQDMLKHVLAVVGSQGTQPGQKT